MGLDQRLQPEVARLGDELGEARRRVEDREQQHEVGAGGAEEVELPGIDDEVLGEDRDGDRGTDRAQVVDRAAEPVRLAQDRDRRGAAGGVRAGAGDDVVRRGDVAGGRRAALDLGDEVEAGRGERADDRAGLRGRGDGTGEAVAPERIELGRTSSRRRSAISRTTLRRGRLRRLGDAHAGAPSCAGASASAAAFAASDTRRSSRSLPSSSIASPASIDQRRPLDPVHDRLDRARRDERGAGVEQHDVPTRARLAAAARPR